MDFQKYFDQNQSGLKSFRPNPKKIKRWKLISAHLRIRGFVFKRQERLFSKSIV
ncbi:hypothetical protein LEP1GSC125_3763 [Leptospira mayottensis 200901122]|uniref:Uncharacterized protein n=1 Tax=Leptospira mayottensis 200901122 TaxID=1193010 RepID=A0AA87MSC5_9LEPT|nr:hypothetical protein LEP1GSC125_3763 [Leptospira mayottensis 200901122]